MSRYIDADALIQLGLQDGAYEYVSVQEIADFPKADVVEVIRCEHCLHWDDEIENGVYVGNLYHCCDYDGEHRDPCDFCSYAERREDAN